MKHLRSTTLGFKDIKIIKSEFVTKTQFLGKYYCKKYGRKAAKFIKTILLSSNNPNEIIIRKNLMVTS